MGNISTFPHLANETLKYKFELKILPTKYVTPKSLSRLANGQVSFGVKTAPKNTTTTCVPKLHLVGQGRKGIGIDILPGPWVKDLKDHLVLT